MHLEYMSDAFYFAGVVAFVLSFPLVYLLVKVKRSKTKYNHALGKVELGAVRSSLEGSIYKINEKFQKDHAGWQELNHLVVDGGDADIKHSGTAENNYGVDQFRFIKNIGIDFQAIQEKDDKVFLITPFHDAYKDEHLAIKEACGMLGLACVRGDEVFKEGNILKHIVEQILSARYVIANLNGRNPNVYYEVGIAQCLGKAVVLVSSGFEEIPFDLQSQRILTFVDLKELKAKLYVKLFQLNRG
ncbi:hypothetical protein ACIGCH_00700 [Pseudomonas helleri]|uniref:Uncharacterized protein n=1 Tax=Pseudomonas helleri TaxID=1608996 RepID=A0A6A7YWG9_9PSED|nr:hypothetical protein [Pseudomonas helleri]MQT25776.1 hypothetical protein [Pseudomonas helleri]MQT81138.1 hypothetical protein [Pseudomonas helleri]MQU17027.1 hypothetical protein [Pseudomonas helleri]MQU26964.1 hypothetical protein [Pseudomonas helleri]